jgi:YaiO family outer membrane protein
MRGLVSGLLALAAFAGADNPLERPWRLDVGGEYSAFTRREQSDWMSGFAQLTRAYSDRTLSVFGRVDGYRQFDLNDMSLEAGAYGRVRDGLYASAMAGYTPASDFKPDYRLAGDLSARLFAAPRPSQLSAWALLAGWYDVYDPDEVWRAAAGLRVHWSEYGFVTGRGTFVHAEGGRSLYGWDGRVDAPVLPGRLRAYFGLADAPETVRATTVSTFSVFGGLACNLGDGYVVSLGYARDDRENAYIRHGFNVALSSRF